MFFEVRFEPSRKISRMLAVSIALLKRWLKMHILGQRNLSFSVFRFFLLTAVFHRTLGGWHDICGWKNYRAHGRKTAAARWAESCGTAVPKQTNFRRGPRHVEMSSGLKMLIGASRRQCYELQHLLLKAFPTQMRDSIDNMVRKRVNDKLYSKV